MVYCDYLSGSGDPGAWFVETGASLYHGVFGVRSIDIEPSSLIDTPDHDVIYHRSALVKYFTELFEQNRIKVRDLFRAMLGSIFECYHIPKTGGLDIGSGPTGEMVHQFLPFSDAQRGTWTESDVNVDSNEANRQRHPGARVEEASMYYLRRDLGVDGGYPVITGLSSLDAPKDLALVLEEVRQSLEIGGFLVHVQDVRPGRHVGVKQLIEEGIHGPYDVVVSPPDISIDLLNPHAYQLESGKLVSSIELFRRFLGNKIRAISGLDLLQNSWICAYEPMPNSSDVEMYCMNMCGKINAKVLKALPSRLAYAVATVARRSA